MEAQQVINTAVPLASIIAITIPLVQVIKHIDEADKLKRFYPLIALVIGTFLGVIVFGVDWVTSIVTGLSASGTFDLGRRTLLDQK